MSDERRLSELMTELRRVGVDPDGFPAGIAVRDDDALRILRELADNAGPEALLSGIRESQTERPGD